MSRSAHLPEPSRPTTPGLRLLCVTAHPDDESGGFGGALLMAAQCGLSTAVLCLTKGSSGSYRSEGQTDAELADMRAVEFADACQYLGAETSILLDYPDGGLWQQPFLPLVETVTRHIRCFRPHIVLTFGGDGGVNQHKDHTVVSLAATAAFHWAAHPTLLPDSAEAPSWAAQKLYYSATQFISSRDPHVQSVATRTPATLQLDVSRLREKKLAAFRCHVSQRGVLDRVLAEFPDAMREEGYLLVAARRPQVGETALWDGLEATE